VLTVAFEPAAVAAGAAEAIRFLARGGATGRGDYAISPGMTRACFLVIDRAVAGNISTRKLVIETALLNVITAYSPEEAIETLVRFPNVDGIVLDTEVQGMTCEQLIQRLRAVRSGLPIMTVSPSGHDRCGGEDYHCSSYDPQDLLEQLKKICPAETEVGSSGLPGGCGAGGKKRGLAAHAASPVR
jgi:CheY-like chemotaxis protein